MDTLISALNIANSALVLPTFLLALALSWDRNGRERIIKRFWKRTIYPAYALQPAALALAVTIGPGPELDNTIVVHGIANMLGSTVSFAMTHGDRIGRAITWVFADQEALARRQPGDAGPDPRPRPERPEPETPAPEKPPFT